MSTPAGIRIATEIDHYFRQLDRERITHWLMQFSAGRTTDIDNGLGGRIRIGGVAFEGSPQMVFWSFIHPILEAKVVEVCAQTEREISGYTPVEIKHTIDAVNVALRAMMSRTFYRMAEVDRLLRGKGFPDRVQKRDVTREVSQHLQFVEANIIALHRRASARPNRSFVGWAHANYWQIIGTLLAALAVLVGWLAL